jgi:hypothetical protein
LWLLRQDLTNLVSDLARLSLKPANHFENRFVDGRNDFDARGRNKLMVMSGEVVMENVRRYRAIASLYRQTAAFRPLQSWSLLEQADEWEHLAVAELEAYFNACNSRHDDQEPQVARYAEARWETALGREADMLCMRTATRLESATVLAA